MFDSEYSFFLILIIGIVIFIFFNFIFKCAKEKEKEEEDKRTIERIRAEVEEERNRPKDAPPTKSQIIFKAIDLSKCILEGNSWSRDVILTSDNKLVFMTRGSNGVFVKKLDDLLQVKFDMQIREKNIMKIISIVPTYDKHTIVEKMSLKFIFMNSTEEIFIIPEDKNITNPLVQYKIDEMERFKLATEKLKNEYDKSKNTITEKEEGNRDIEIKKTKADEVKIIEELVPTDEEIAKLEDKVYEWERFLINEKNELYFIQPEVKREKKVGKKTILEVAHEREENKIDVNDIKYIKIVLPNNRECLYEGTYIPKNLEDINEDVRVLRFVIKMKSGNKKYKDYRIFLSDCKNTDDNVKEIFEELQIFRMKIQQIINNENM
ncbi:hypothetical protein KGF51_08185 [Clostridioides sp. ZZV14-6045]|uniref:hypothetical protein n=1 Tax=Clostridioides sp. ZZV14-6045 TaxID=2811489 RepID=UPI001D1099E1|nr:hypothetical protein [Clostridioides sp. ZZV14-6045]